MNCQYRDQVRRFVKQLKDKERERSIYLTRLGKSNHSWTADKSRERRTGRRNHGLTSVASDIDDSDSDSRRARGASNSDADSENEPEVAALTKEQRDRASRKHPQS